MSIEELGKPVGSVFAITGGKARFYERGLSIFATSPSDVEVHFQFAMIGRPDVVTGTFTHSMHVLRSGWVNAQLEATIQDALRDRICLVAVGQPEMRIPLVGGSTLTAAGLQDRQLYDIAVRVDDGWHVVAPHSVYCRTSWTDFGIAHITDMHVASRIDKFRGYLREVGRNEAADRMYNWNDRFRGFVRYANYLHSIGVLDVIVTTGDNYDYQFEADDVDRSRGGNAAFLRDLILGKAPGPDFSDVEELRIPIFIVSGNHDYRVNPYMLVCDVHVKADIDAQFHINVVPNLADMDLQRVPTYSGFHLTGQDAALVTNRLAGRSGDSVPNVSPKEAATMVDVDKENKPFRQCLGEPGSYVVKLGTHRIAMIDSGMDKGMVTSVGDAFKVWTGWGSEDQNAFVGSCPNCDGISDQAMEVVNDIFADKDATGLFILGLHAPLFNPPHDAYSYFLRETQRASYQGEVEGLLARTPFQASPGDDLLKRVEANHPSWFPKPGGNDHRSPTYVKRESSDDQFDCGVSRGAVAELTKLIAGVGSPRAADLVLAGHTHLYNEYRVGKGWNSDELVFYFDFYTQNPTTYYQTQFTRQWLPAGNGRITVKTDATYIEVVPGAEPDAKPWPMPFVTDGDSRKHMLQVPPYANPLNSAPDPAAWWDQHRPLVLQTGALGPLRSHEFFSGFRVLAVKNNIIDKIHYVSTQRLEANKYRIAWDEAIKPETTPRPYQYVERSRPLKSPPAVGAPSAIAFPALGSTTIVYRDGAGHLHELWRKGSDRGTSDLTTLASNAMPAAGDPTSYIDTIEGLEVALYRGTDGHVYSLYWSTGEVRRDSLSAPINAPRAAGNPVGYVGKDAFRHVIYRAQDGHIEELWWKDGDPPGSGDISTRVGAPKAAGDPTAYQKPTTGENVVVYRGQDHHIHGLYWLTDVRHDDLSGFARAPDAAGDPTAYYMSSSDVNQIVYRSADGHLHELWWQGNNPVSHWDLTAAAKDLADGKSPAALAANDPTGDPISYYNAANNTKHVIYRSSDGHINELSWVPGTATPVYVDLTAWAVAPVAADKPGAFVVAPNTQSVLYRGTDNQIHEIRWSQPTVAREFATSTLIAGVLFQPAQPTQPIEPVVTEARWHRVESLRPR